MNTRKTDVVRRSLFGSAVAGHAAEEAEQVDPAPTRPRQRAARSRQSAGRGGGSGPVVEPSPAARQGRRPVERTAVTVPTDLLLQVKDAVAVLNGWPHQYTMARFVEEAFSAHLERLKAEYNGGRAFPETNRKIRTGRPPGR